MTDVDALICGDHARGCAGRTYSCTCGYDGKIAAALAAQAQRIAELSRQVKISEEIVGAGMDTYLQTRARAEKAEAALRAREPRPKNHE